MVEACKKAVGDIKNDITAAIDGSTEKLNKAAYKITKERFKDILISFTACLFLCAASFLAIKYYVGYTKGLNKARSEATEILEIEREKIQQEAIENYKNSSQFLEDVNGKRTKIEEDAINSYKNSERFREDACKEVASNICYINTDYYLYKYMRSTDLNEYPDLKTFYDSYLKRGWKLYKESKKK